MKHTCCYCSSDATPTPENTEQESALVKLHILLVRLAGVLQRLRADQAQWDALMTLTLWADRLSEEMEEQSK